MSDHFDYDRIALRFELGKFKEAERTLREILTNDPENACALSLLGRALAACGTFEEAERCVETAISLEPDEPFHFENKAMCMLWMERNEDALFATKEALRLNSESEDVFKLKSMCELNLQRYSLALDSVEQGLEMNAENADCLALKALILVHMNRVNDARKCIDESLRIDPNSSRPHAAHGWVLLREKENRRSLDSFKLSLRMNPKERVALKGLREALMKNSRLFFSLSTYSSWLAARPVEKIERLITLEFYLFLISLMLLLLGGGPRIFAQCAIIPQLAFAFLSGSKEDLQNFVMIFHSFGRWSVPPLEKMLSIFAVVHTVITMGFACYGALSSNTGWSVAALGALLYFIPLNCLKKNPGRPEVWLGLVLVLVLGGVGISSATVPFVRWWSWCAPYVWGCLLFRRTLEAFGSKPLNKPLSVEERKRYR